MERPKIEDYQTANQFTYEVGFQKYYAALEKYCDHLELSLQDKSTPDDSDKEDGGGCKHKNETIRQGDGFTYVICSDCGRDL